LTARHPQPPIGFDHQDSIIYLSQPPVGALLTSFRNARHCLAPRHRWLHSLLHGFLIVRKSHTVGHVIGMGMVQTQAEQSDWFDWLQHDKSLIPERVDDLVVTSVEVLQLNGRLLYLKRTTDLADFNPAERRILEALARQGDTVFVAVGPDPEHLRLSYRLPDLENAVAFDADSLLGLIRQWFVWASTS
jgi:hypothetical protein